MSILYMYKEEIRFRYITCNIYHIILYIYIHTYISYMYIWYTYREKKHINLSIYINILKIIFWYDQLTTVTNAPLNSSGAFKLLVPYGSRVRRNQESKALSSILRRCAYLLYCICTKLYRNNNTSVLLTRNISILTIPYLLFYCIAMTWGFTDLVRGLGIMSRALSSLCLPNHILCRNIEFLLSYSCAQSRQS